ncbi:MAG: ribonuclease H-like domain-containing protein [bacterium]|nr:ribonuclease H-like domain-containing protein [bacterium]
MDLKQRLTVLRRQRGDVASDTAALPLPVEQRLQRLYGRQRPQTSQARDEQEVADLLGGTRIADGLIVVEQQFPLSHQHGKHRFETLRPRLSFHLPGDSSPSTEQLVFMDTETTGLAGGTGTLAFLLGLGRMTDETFYLRQFFLTGFRGEVALLQAARDWVDDREYLVTFNGKSFDAPLMATRYRLSGIPDPFAAMHHIDLFHPTRRAFRNQWVDCRLQTAERCLLGFHRQDDLPAYLVPEVWFAFVRRGITRQLPGILAHNRWDLMSLATLLPSLTEAFTAPGESGADVVAVARYWLQRGDEQTALAHLRAHQDQLTTTGLLELARLYRRCQAWQHAVPIWRQLAEQDCPQALERLAKYNEHVQHDYEAALQLTQRLRHLDQHNSSHQQRQQRLTAKRDRH